MQCINNALVDKRGLVPSLRQEFIRLPTKCQLTMLCDSISLNWWRVSYFASPISISASSRAGEGKKERSANELQLRSKQNQMPSFIARGF
jgi:hypothetical protein